MPKLTYAHVLAGISLFCLASGPVLAQTVATPNMATVVKLDNVDNAAYAEWHKGEEKSISGGEGRSPSWVVWTDKGHSGFSGYYFGDTKTPGIRHLRIGFKNPIEAGTILVRGGGTLSVLKPDAAYPGAISDDSQWMPAQRLHKGELTSAEVRSGSYALWTLPPGTQVRALRFTHNAGADDLRHAGWLGGVFLLNERLINVAPLAVAAASTSNQFATRVNNGSDDGFNAWENVKPQADVSAGAKPVTPENPEKVMLTWPEPVQISGLNALWAGFSAAEVQLYTGPADSHPRDASESDWKTIKSFKGLKTGYPIQLWPNRLDFDKVVTARAIRLILTDPADENTHSHLKGSTQKGKRVWVGEIMAFQPLDKNPLKEVKFALPTDNAPKPPIPVRFKLDKPGYVTLVIEDPTGKRVRNLVSETFFPAGDNTAWWDGTDDLGRDTKAAEHGLYKIPAQFVPPGSYRVRGLVRDKIDLRYEFSVYNEGNPPWTTPDTTGGWLTNHTPAQAALFLPADKTPDNKPLVFLGCLVSEGGSGLAWVDLDGRKQGGRGWIGGHWTSAPFLAGDFGAKPVKSTYAYVGAVGESSKGGRTSELRITGLSKSGDKEILRHLFEARSGNRAAEISGLAVRDGILIVSMVRQKQLLFADAREKKVLGTTPMDSPRGLAFDANGRLLVLDGTRLVRFETGTFPLGTPKTVLEGLESPNHLALDSKGNIYISDRGQSHQVKVFDANGKPLRTIGKAGVPKAGPYDQLRMNNPAGLAIDEKNQLWVTETDYLPKRVSVWTLDGQLIKAFYGPSKYGGGGTLDSQDKTRFYYADEARGTMEFKLDWKTGSFKLANILYRPEKEDLKLSQHSAAPELALYHNGKRYFSNCYNSNPVSGASVSFLFREDKGLLYPVMAAGRANDWDLLKEDTFKPVWPASSNLKGDMFQDKSKNQVFFLWSDLNGDAKVQPEEVTCQQGVPGGVTIMPDFSLCVARLNGKSVKFALEGFTPTGAPSYDLTKPQVLAEKMSGPPSSGGDQVLAGKDGYTVATLGARPFHSYSVSGLKDGVPLWSYPNLWPGLHPSHTAAKPDRPGQLIGVTRMLGGFVTPKSGEAGQIWGVNANMGSLYLFTADGLFVGTLFDDVRQARLWQIPIAERNMKLENISLAQENFWPTMTQTEDGNIYLSNGADTAIVRVDGLDTIRRIAPMPLQITAKDLEGAQKYLVSLEMQRQQQHGRGVLEVALRKAAPTVDGNLNEWENASWVDIDKSGAGANFDSANKPFDITAAVSISGDRLYAAWKTGNSNLLNNSGEEPTAPFKTGGALDIMLATNPKANPKRPNPVAGDLRLLITQAKGKPMAVLYRAVVPGTTDPVPFSSPWRTITLDKVENISDQIQLAGKNGNYEISVPLNVLGLQPEAGQVIQGDIGVLRGDGGKTTARNYWSNKSAGIVADVPSEAQLAPQLWGKVEFKATS